jgi:hypothetical protein
MEPGNRHVSVIRRVRDHKSIQVDLIFANAIKEADEEDSEGEETQGGPRQDEKCEIISVVVEKQVSGKIESQVQISEQGVTKCFSLQSEKVLLHGFGELDSAVEQPDAINETEQEGENGDAKPEHHLDT